MFKWLHHLFNPHCELCESDKICNTCEFLKVENARLQITNDRLIERLLNANIDKDNKVENSNNEVQHEVVKPNFIPWHVRRKMLEDKDREEAQLIEKKKNENKDINKTIKEHTVVLSDNVNKLEEEILNVK